MKRFLSIFFLFSGFADARVPAKESALDLLLIEGKLSQAEIDLVALPRESTRRYYRGWIAHIKGDYTKEFKELSWWKFNIENYYHQVCQLKLISLWKMGELREFEREADICFSAVSGFSPSEMLWFQSLLFMGKKSLDPFLFGERGPEIWLKAGIYLQHDKMVEKTLLQFSNPEDESPSTRELIALHHYRQGDYKKAFEWAAKTSGVNASNILGRVYLAGGDFKSSWKHFNKALEIRKDSLHALEYLPSLAWILGHWKKGREFLLRLSRLRRLTVEELTLLSAFTIQEGNFESARRVLGMLEGRFENTLPMEGLLMGGYISLMNGDDLTLYAVPACLESEGVYCWLLQQQLNWDDFEGLPRREELIFGELEPDIDGYREKVEIRPLEEKIIVLSKDIEELDRRELKEESEPHPQETDSVLENLISDGGGKPPSGKGIRRGEPIEIAKGGAKEKAEGLRWRIHLAPR